MASYILHSVINLNTHDAIVVETTSDYGEAKFRASLRDGLGCVGTGATPRDALLSLTENIKRTNLSISTAIERSPMAPKPKKPRLGILTEFIHTALGYTLPKGHKVSTFDISEQLDAQGERILLIELIAIDFKQLRTLSQRFCTDDIEVCSVSESDLVVRISNISSWPEGLTP